MQFYVPTCVAHKRLECIHSFTLCTKEDFIKYTKSGWSRNNADENDDGKMLMIQCSH